MRHLDKEIAGAIPIYLKPIDTIWQPSDLLPGAHDESFYEELQELKRKASNLSYDLFAVLIGDTITEEVLPTYEAWLSGVHSGTEDNESGWHKWVRGWTSEENRHGDVLNRYLYLSGRVNMREMEMSTQHLLNDGFDIGTARDPYNSFIYTSFQELATNLSHRRVAQIAKKEGDDLLARLCGHVASDEARHANAYKSFVEKIFEIDPNQMMLSFEHMMRHKIVMPAHNMRENGQEQGGAFRHFAEAAQRQGVYTTADYIDILRSLIKEWKIDSMRNLSESGEKARDYLMALPARLEKLAERITPKYSPHKFSWISV